MPTNLAEPVREFLAVVKHLHPFARLIALITAFFSPIVAFVLLRARKQIQSWLAYIFDALIVYPIGRWLQHSVSARATLRRYCLLCQSDEQVQYLNVPARQEIKLRVDDIFVPLQLEAHGIDPEIYTHADLLSLGTRLRVIGDPGSGKSSLIKRIYLDCCWTGIHLPSSSRLPCLINLNRLSIPNNLTSAKSGQWLYGYIRQMAARTAVFKMNDCFESYANSSGLLILLDGLDEVSRSQYPKLQNAIDQLSTLLSRKSEKNIIVQTMRTQFYQEIRYRMREETGRAVYVKPLSPTDIYEFLRRWPFRKDGAQRRNKIYGDLSDRPTLRDMCTNPLVLSMFVGEYNAVETFVTPESRTEFYARVTEELLIRRRLRQTERPAAPHKLREQREQILGRLALAHLLDPSQPSNSLTIDSLKEIICQVTKCDLGKAEAIYRDLARETGLISEEKPGETIRFIHLTFCEYLAAREAVQGQTQGFEALCSAHETFQEGSDPQNKTRLLEVLPFASGLLVRRERPQALRLISDFNDYRLSARCFLETKAYEDPSWLMFVGRAMQEFISRSTTPLDDAWLRDLHLFNVVVRDAEQSLGYLHSGKQDTNLNGFYDSVLKSSKDRIEVLLATYAQQDAAAAFRLADSLDMDLLSQFPSIIVSSCDQRPFLEMVIEKIATLEESQRQMWALLVVEASIRYKVVADMLIAHEPDNRLLDFGKPMMTTSQRVIAGAMKSGFYSDLLALAMACDRTPQGLVLLKAAKYSRFGFGSWAILPTVQLVIIVLVLVVCALVFTAPFVLGLHGLGLRGEFIAITALYVLEYFLVRGVALRRAIRSFFNVRTSQSGPVTKYAAKFMLRTPFILGNSERFLVLVRHRLEEGIRLGKELPSLISGEYVTSVAVVSEAEWNASLWEPRRQKPVTDGDKNRENRGGRIGGHGE